MAEALAEPAAAAFTDLDGIHNAVMICFNSNLLFNTVDVLLGGDPEVEATTSARPPTALDDRLTGSLANAVLSGFAKSCNQAMGTNAVNRFSLMSIEHDKHEIDLAPAEAGILCVRTSAKIGQLGRGRVLEIYIALSTIDLVSTAGGGASPAIEFGNGRGSIICGTLSWRSNWRPSGFFTQKR